MSLVHYPNPIFKKTAQPVTSFDEQLRQDIEKMMIVMKDNRAIGLGANMCGILKRIIIVPQSQHEQEGELRVMINPEIIEKSPEMQTFTEASLSFPGIEAPVTRAQSITLSYQDETGKQCEITETGFLSTVIQHEIDYLNGVIFLDHLPKVKAKMLKDKSQKYLKKIGRQLNNPSHHHHQHHHHHHHHDGCCDHDH